MKKNLCSIRMTLNATKHRRAHSIEINRDNEEAEMKTNNNTRRNICSSSSLFSIKSTFVLIDQLFLITQFEKKNLSLF